MRKYLTSQVVAAVLLAVVCLATARPAAADSTLIDAVRGTLTEVGSAALRDGMSLDEAVSRAEAQYRARVVRAEVDERDGRVIYVLRLLSDDGRVFTVRIDAASGGRL
jgi:uncharacterized membrane protein YkoI